MAFWSILGSKRNYLDAKERSFYCSLIEKCGPDFFTVAGETEFYQRFAEGAGHVSRCVGLGVYIITDASSGMLEPKAFWGRFPLFNDSNAKDTPLPQTGTVFDEALIHGKPLQIHDLQNQAEPGNERRTQIGAVLAVPFTSGGRLFGLCVFVKGKEEASFSSDESERLSGMVKIAAELLSRLEAFSVVLERKGMDSVLTLGEELHARLCATSFPEIEGAALAGFRRPLKGVHSDYYDAFLRKRGDLLFVHGEVAGKSFSAVMTNLILWTIAHLLGEKIADPADGLHWMNRSVGRKFEMDMFASLGLFFYEPTAKIVTFAVAGNLGMFHFHHESLTVEPVRTEFIPLGIDPGSRYRSLRIKMEPGDILATFSDGVVDAMDSSGTLFGSDRISHCLRDNYYLSAQSLSDKIEGILTAYRENGRQSDDESLLILKAL